MRYPTANLTTRAFNRDRAGHWARTGVAVPKLRRYVSRRWLRLVIVLGGFVILATALIWSTGARGLFLGLLLGASFATFACGIAWLVVEASGARAPLIGSVGERWTADELAKLGKGWVRIDSVPFGTDFDVDHVVFGNAGVFAVETKFTATEWFEGRNSLLSHAVDNARWKARKIALLLHGAGRPDVTPMLVIWGPGAPALSGGYQVIDGVLVCRGQDGQMWREHLQQLPPVLRGSQLGGMTAFVMDQVRRTEAAAHSAPSR